MERLVQAVLSTHFEAFADLLTDDLKQEIEQEVRQEYAEQYGDKLDKARAILAEFVEDEIHRIYGDE